MAHFAQIDKNNIVTQVIVVNNTELIDETGTESEAKGAEFCKSLFGGRWIQTSYNATIRKHFAGTGYIYDETRDAFLPPHLYPSWTLDEETCAWIPPVPIPDLGGPVEWNEEKQAWELLQKE
jgi:hypothetical protein